MCSSAVHGTVHSLLLRYQYSDPWCAPLLYTVLYTVYCSDINTLILDVLLCCTQYTYSVYCSDINTLILDVLLSCTQYTLVQFTAPISILWSLLSPLNCTVLYCTHIKLNNPVCLLIVVLTSFKGTQVWDFRSLGFLWFLLHKAFLGWWLWG